MIGKRLLATILATLAPAGAFAAGPDLPSLVPAAPLVRPGARQLFRTASPVLVNWSVEEAPLPPGPPRFPLRIAADGRYLVDQGGRPWRIQADAAWLMSVLARPADVDRYLDIRKAQGFNAFYLQAIVHPGGYPSAPRAPANLDGDPPFATPGRFTTAGASPASASYWAGIDAIIDSAARRNMVVMLAFTYLGYGGGPEGWYQELLAQPGRDDCRSWGRWLGSRYRDRPNVIWFALGDFTPPQGSEGAVRALEIVRGIREAGARQLLMAEPSGPDGIPLEVPGIGPLLDVDSFYGYGPQGKGLVYLTADRAFRAQPARPAFMQEGTYEYENNTGGFSGQPWDTRRGRFWSVLAGGTAGDGFGSRDAWQWRNLPASLSTPGAAFATAAFDLFASMPWWELRPLQGSHSPIVSGGGTWGRPDFVTAASTVTREWMLAYVPPTGTGTRSLEVDLRGLAGPVRARWFDPAGGSFLAISDGHEYPPTGSLAFHTPGSRPDGTDDWLLVLDAPGGRCGSIDPGGLYTAPATAPPDVICRVTARPVQDPSLQTSVAIRFQ